MTTLALLVVAAVAVVLVAPIRISVDWSGWPDASETRFRVQVRWLLFTWRTRRARPGSRSARKRRARRTVTKRTSRHHWRRVAAVPGLVPRVARLFVDLARVLAPRAVDARIQVGFDDPVVTGVWCGATHVMVGAARAAGWQLQLEPDFSGPQFAGDVHAEWSVRPGRVLWPVTTFLCSPIAWRAGLAALRGRRVADPERV